MQNKNFFGLGFFFFKATFIITLSHSLLEMWRPSEFELLIITMVAIFQNLIKTNNSVSFQLKNDNTHNY